MPGDRAYRAAGFEAADDQAAIDLAKGIEDPREIEPWCGPLRIEDP